MVHFIEKFRQQIHHHHRRRRRRYQANIYSYLVARKITGASSRQIIREVIKSYLTNGEGLA